jgi:acyl CoA:acetate/3-ketoacid CoA transferase beta subunit
MSLGPDDYSVDELICVCISRQVQDGEVLAQGLATPLVAAGYLLAWHTHAPNVYFASAIGQSICREGAAIGMAYAEALWLDKAMSTFGFVRAATDLLPRIKPKEFFRPGQVDPLGNFNNIAFGKDYRRPRMRMPGSGGIPDVTTFLDGIYLYVPRHSRVTFVEELDFCSGLGNVDGRKRGRGAHYLVSNFGEFDFASGRMRLRRIFPGISVERVQAKTGFELEVAPDLEETEPPNEEELRLLREQIDPLGIRRLELLGGAKRRSTMRGILEEEEIANRRKQS